MYCEITTMCKCVTWESQVDIKSIIHMLSIGICCVNIGSVKRAQASEWWDSPK